MPPTAPTSTRTRLLEAAGEVFATEGYAKATIRGICRRADANVAAVNYHFGDKEGLYREVFRHAFQELHDRAPWTTDPDAPWEERVETFVASFLERLLSAGESWHGRLMAHELAEPGPALGDVVTTFMRPQIELLHALIEEVRPDLDEQARELHALSLIGHCVFFRHARPVIDLLYGRERYARADLPKIREHVVSLFRRGLGLPEGTP